MADEFAYITFDAFHDWMMAKEFLDDRHSHAEKDRRATVWISTPWRATIPAIEKAAHDPEEASWMIYGAYGAGKGSFSSKFWESGRKYVFERQIPELEEILEPKAGQTASLRALLALPKHSQFEPHRGDTENVTDDPDERLKEIRKLLRESEKLGEQVRNEIDSLKQRSGAK